MLQKILDALTRVTKNRTTIVIAHRLSTVVDADEILVLKKGAVAERGNHQELMNKQDSLYADLWQKQNQIALELSKSNSLEVDENNNEENKNHREKVHESMKQ